MKKAVFLDRDGTINIDKGYVHLYIFVVEEDKSIYSFKEHFQLVENGTQDLNNTTIIPSGKFILSAITFSEYFFKDFLQDVIVNTSTDINIFVKYIAPTLNISYRFVGEEPIDLITKQHNIALWENLPRYGITVIEIPRIQSSDGYPISASRVRKLLEEDELVKLSEIMPDTTNVYSKSKYISIHSITQQMVISVNYSEYMCCHH